MQTPLFLLAAEAASQRTSMFRLEESQERRFFRRWWYEDKGEGDPRMFTSSGDAVPCACSWRKLRQRAVGAYPPHDAVTCGNIFNLESGKNSARVLPFLTGFLFLWFLYLFTEKVLTYNIIWCIVSTTSNIICHIILHEQEER